jgi:hypothetical protein
MRISWDEAIFVGNDIKTGTQAPKLGKVNSKKKPLVPINY